MTTTVMNKAYAGHEPRVDTKSQTGLFGRLFARLIAAREAEARTKVAQHLTTMSDRHLVELGMSARDIELIRQNGRFNVDLAG